MPVLLAYIDVLFFAIVAVAGLWILSAGVGVLTAAYAWRSGDRPVAIGCGAVLVLAPLVPLAGLALLRYGPWTGVEAEVVHPMTWAPLPASELSSDSGHAGARLTFVEHPGHSVTIESDPVVAELERWPGEVPVTFRVTRDFGRVRGFSEVQVGGLRGFPVLGGSYRRSGVNPGAGPFDDR